MAIFKVELTRSQRQTIYVETDHTPTAMRHLADDAWELVDERQWDDNDEDVDVEAVASSGRAPYWTGGPSGHWVTP